MAVGWKELRLGDVCELKYGKSLPKAKRSGEGYAVFGSNGQVGSHKDALTAGKTIIVGRKGSLGEVTFSYDRCWAIDTTYYIDESATTTDLRWLYYRMKAMPLTLLNRAAAIPGLNREDAYSQPLLLPPIEEQRRIAAVLDAADALRTKRRLALEKLDFLIHAIFIDMFGACEGKKKQLGHLAEVQGGLQVTPKRKIQPISVPYLRVANVYRGVLDLSEIKTLQVSEKEFARTRLVTGDLLVVEGHGNKDEIGRVGVWDGSIDPCVHQNHLIRVRCDHNQLLSRFAEAFMNSKAGRRALLQASNTTSGLNTISTNDVREVEIPLPTLSDQQRFVQLAGCVDRQRAKLTTAGADLDILFASLQQRAFRGEL